MVPRWCLSSSPVIVRCVGVLVRGESRWYPGVVVASPYVNRLPVEFKWCPGGMIVSLGHRSSVLVVFQWCPGGVLAGSR